MAPNTPLEYRGLVIYEAFPRNHSPQGNFAGLEADLERIRHMGVDILWLMPVHPIGKIDRKGTLGSPYSIVDYRAINPEYGTHEDFLRLVERAHALGLKVMMDIVFNHTAHDSVLLDPHPDWYHQDASGRPFTTVPAWSDVIDLNHPHPGLWEYLTETLVGWADAGVDGFRCDVASLVPVEFWVQARQAVEAAKPGVIWLAESVHAGFVEGRRDAGLYAASDSELYAAFDLTYDYDIWPVYQMAVAGRAPVGRYLEMLRFQDAIYPANYVKMRCVENHDQPRIQRLAPSLPQAMAWTAFEAFNKGAFLIYAGQEAAADHTPSLFERDPIQWNDYPLQPFLTSLAGIKKEHAIQSGTFFLLEGEPAIQAAWHDPMGSLFGLFNVTGAGGPVSVPLADGRYEDLIGGGEVMVQNGRMELPESAVIARCELPKPAHPVPAPLLDFQIPAE